MPRDLPGTHRVVGRSSRCSLRNYRAEDGNSRAAGFSLRHPRSAMRDRSTSPGTGSSGASVSLHSRSVTNRHASPAISRSGDARPLRCSSSGWHRSASRTSRGRGSVGAIIRQTVIAWAPSGGRGAGLDARRAAYGPAAGSPGEEYIERPRHPLTRSRPPSWRQRRRDSDEPTSAAPRTDRTVVREAW